MEEKRERTEWRILIFICFICGIVLLPFTNFKGSSLLREYAQESAIYFWLLGGVILCTDVFLNKRKVYFPFRSSLVVIFSVFIVWCCLTYLFNFSSIQTNFLKGRTGNHRFVSQLLSLLLSGVFLVYFFWNVIRSLTIKQLLFYVRGIIGCSFILVFMYGVIELIAVKWNSTILKDALLSLNVLPFFNKETFYDQRISSVSFEVPSLGNYLIFVAGWMFSYLLTMKKKWLSVIPTFMLLFLVIVSGARAAMVIVFFQFFVFLICLSFTQRYQKWIRTLFIMGVGGFAILALVFGGRIRDKLQHNLNFFTVENNISNQTRYGMQAASLQVFMDHPITGVGYGQNSFHKKQYYPAWALHNNYEFTAWYLNDNVPEFPPDFNIYTRLLAETGLVGFVLFGSFLFMCIKRTYQCIKKSKQEENVIGVILLISFIGFVLNWLQVDYMRQLGFWICFSLLLKLIYNKVNQQYEKDNCTNSSL